MTIRESLRQLVEEIDEDQLETLARLAREGGFVVEAMPQGAPVAWIEGRQYPALASIWDNDDDAIFDDL